MIFFALWWTFDDHLATALDVEALGSLPVWVPLLMGLALTGRLTVRQLSLTNRVTVRRRISAY